MRHGGIKELVHETCMVEIMESFPGSDAASKCPKDIQTLREVIGKDMDDGHGYVRAPQFFCTLVVT
jgi:hypothetical protein